MSNPKPLTYLGCPYTGTYDQRVARFEAVTRATAHLIRTRGWTVFSPITHSHPLEQIGGLRGDWAFWRRQDENFLWCSNQMIILTLPGWEFSEGIAGEITIATKLDIPIYLLDEKTYGLQRFVSLVIADGAEVGTND
jgi:hypothetical protein